MRKNTIIFIGIIILVLAVNLLLPSIKENKYKNTIFNDLKDQAEEQKKAVVGIILEKDNSTSYSGIGSGVVFAKSGNIYYILTAKHVIDDKNAKIRIFTTDTKFSGQRITTDDNTTFEIPDNSYYKSLLEGQLEYKSKDKDLAIISFKYDGNLSVLNLSKEKIAKNERVIAIGHTEGNKYNTTYGYIKSDIKTIKSTYQGKRNKERIIEHNAYINYGNSGGPVLNEDMDIIGINIMGIFNTFRKFQIGYMIPSEEILKEIKNWQPKSEGNNKDKKTSNWYKEKVTMTLTNISKENSTATLIIEDKNEKPATWGMEFAIQKQSSGDKKWYDLPSNKNIEWLRALAAPNEKGICKLKLDWSKMYGKLDKGTYRVVKYNGLKTIYSEPFQI